MQIVYVQLYNIISRLSDHRMYKSLDSPVTIFSRILLKRKKFQYIMSEENIDRRMKYPYTLSAKLAQFPYKHYFNNPYSWIFKWWFAGALVTLPIFYKIQKLSYSPGNVEKWNEIHRKQFSGEHEH
ncbi:reduction of Rh1 [Augochlora pura]